LFPLRECLAVTGAFGQYLAQSFSASAWSPRSGRQRRQVAPGQVPVNPLVDAAKLLDAVQR